jgi:hypothetical protein
MAHEGLIAENMKKGMQEWAEYLVRERLFPICLVTIRKDPSTGNSEVAFLPGPTMTGDRVKEYLQFLLDNWEAFKPV